MSNQQSATVSDLIQENAELRRLLLDTNRRLAVLETEHKYSEVSTKQRFSNLNQSRNQYQNSSSQKFKHLDRTVEELRERTRKLETSNSNNVQNLLEDHIVNLANKMCNLEQMVQRLEDEANDMRLVIHSIREKMSEVTKTSDDYDGTNKGKTVHEKLKYLESSLNKLSNNFETQQKAYKVLEEKVTDQRIGKAIFGSSLDAFFEDHAMSKTTPTPASKILPSKKTTPVKPPSKKTSITPELKCSIPSASISSSSTPKLTNPPLKPAKKKFLVVHNLPTYTSGMGGACDMVSLSNFRVKHITGSTYEDDVYAIMFFNTKEQVDSTLLSQKCSQWKNEKPNTSVYIMYFTNFPNKQLFSQVGTPELCKSMQKVHIAKKSSTKLMLGEIPEPIINNLINTWEHSKRLFQ